jgi:predicted branched-subunit amino acid permease
MRSLTRTDPLVRSVLAVAAAVFVVGASFGAIAAAAHVRLLEAMAMSVFVFAGGSQFLAVGVVSAGGSALAAVFAGLVLNARHLPFGLAIGDVIGRRPLHRAVGSHLIVDESVAFALSQDDPDSQRRAYWLAGSALFVSWNVGTVLGFVAGASVGDPTAFGIDAAFPAGLLALLWPTLRERPQLRVAVVSGALALATTPFLPPGLPVLVALLGLAAALPVPRQLQAKK